MVRKLYLTIITVLSFSVAAFAQAGAGSLKGTIKDSKTGEPIPFANVVVEVGGIQLGTGQSNFDGEYQIKPLDPGSYEVKTSYVGYKPIKTTGVIVSAGKITTVDVKLESSVVEIKTYEVVAYDVPLIDDYQGKTVTKEEIYALPTRNVNSVAATTAGVTQSDEGSGINVRGSRGDATFYFVDGIKVRGSTNIPQQGIEQIQIITGGLPAMYGDATGGVISITTRGPSQEINGGLEYVRSVDGFGYNLLGFNLTGPVLMKKMADGKKKPMIGFFISSEFLNEADSDPSAVGITRLKKDALASIEQNPLRVAPLGIGRQQNASFVRTSDLENVKRKENSRTKRASIAGKLDFKVSETANITVGGTFDYEAYNGFSLANSMFNSVNNGHAINQTMRGYAKFTQRLGGSDQQNNANVIKNVFYTIQADYTRTNSKSYSEDHKDDLFNYGYIGKFKTYRIADYGFGIDTVNGVILGGVMQRGFRDTLFTFVPGTQNPIASNYTRQYYDLANGVKTGFYENFTQVQQGKGLLNGDLPDAIYSMYSAPGTVYNGNAKSQSEQFRIVGSASADIKGHEIGFGFEYEQRVDRGYSIAPVGLWTIMRQLANRHIDQLDLTNPIATYNDNGVFTDSIKYNRLVNLSNQSFFDKNLRESLGLSANGTNWIDIDNLDPSQYSLRMFSADELLNQGGSGQLVSFNGYDAYGSIVKGRRSLDSFFNDKDENGNYKREIGAFTPIYMAAYLQDKFAFKDLIFNVGLRIDRFDANQSVAKDLYSLYETRKAGEFKFSGDNARPSNIGDDYVVYVRDINNTDLSNIDNIIGYRDGKRWYNKQGVEISDPIVIAQSSSSGRATPALLDPTNQKVTSSAFQDYKPQTNFLPRIAFQFPISDVAQFFAHYDVLTQRPTSGIRIDPLDYLFLANTTGSTINNPDLKPQRTIDYEVGYKQALNQSSALTLSAFYREMRNLIQVIPVNYAYPVNYTTFGNIDFGTVKGLSLAYDLRRTGNVRLTANYTLQFADGTGSSSTTGVNLINSGQPNLRTAIPLDFDTRHQIQTTFDYRYDEGKLYNGPRIAGKNVLENAGLNVVMIANSGTPYTRSSYYFAEAQGTGTPILKGSVNGSRLPFQFRINVRVDKSFTLNYGKKNGEEERKSAELQIYCLVQNILNTKNIIGVYRATGNPSDDGYLTAATSQSQIANQVDPISFADLYTVRANNPNNFARPRVIRFGAILNF
jgi:outer membrane receptor protein involved in Fe transport